MSNELAQRAVACPGWRWLPGMLICPRAGDPAYRIVGVWLVEEKQTHSFSMDPATIPMRRDPLGLPDLSDDLTRLGLLALVREAWDCPTAYFTHMSGQWLVMRRDPLSLPLCEPQDTEAEALVAALEAAP